MGIMDLEDLKRIGEAPDWLTIEGFSTISRGYLLEGETPKDMYLRVANSSAKYLNKPELAAKFFNLIWNNWLCLATPVAANAGTTRGHVISCFGSHIGDSVLSIMTKAWESGMLLKHGGGVGIYAGDLRGKGLPIGNSNGVTDGIVPFCKIYESVAQGISQGGTRRGSLVMYLPAEHNQAEEFVDIRRDIREADKDLTGKILSTNWHHAMCLSDDFMDKCKSGGIKERNLWLKILKARHEKGEPYIMWQDNANRQAPECYKANGLKISTSQLCNEIYLYTDERHTFVCCLSSLNVARWDEWKNTDAIELATWFLDGIMEEFIQRAKDMPGFEDAVRSAIKGRPLGLGQLGWHTLLQSRGIPFESYEAMSLNAEIAKTIDDRSLEASKALAAEYGEPEWCKGFGIRNTHRIAIAPTFSNALISGGVSQGIEPIASNVFAQKTAKGMFIRKNEQLRALLQSKGRDTMEVWEQINDRKGSVAGLSFLSSDEKAVFATAREINQFAIVRQAAQRQQFIDQGQSVNLFFAAPEDISNEKDRARLGQYIHEVHKLAYELGLKGLYYLKSSAILSGDKVFRDESDCLSCEG